jgi:hypothetical protein
LTWKGWTAVTARLHGCLLSASELKRAREEYALAASHYQAAGRIDGDVAQVNLRGDKPAIAALLDGMIARESGCCGHLRFAVEEASEGYRVTITVEDAPALERPVLADILPVLFPAAALTVTATGG